MNPNLSHISHEVKSTTFGFYDAEVCATVTLLEACLDRYGMLSTMLRCDSAAQL